MSVKEKKDAYFTKLMDLFQTHSKLFIVNMDMVSSKQAQTVRFQLRGKGEMLMGKNTMIRKCIRNNLTEYPQLDCLLEYVVGNTGFIFVKDDFSAVRNILKENFIGAAARAGVLAPIDVRIPAGVTTLQPTETSFFQAINIATKITKGAIEILQDVDLIKKGRKVMPGEAALLQKMGIKPFTYGIEIIAVYENGSVFEPNVLDITDEHLLGSFQAGVSRVAALSLAAGYPTLVSVPHSLINGYKNVLSIALVTDYTFPLAKKLKDLLSDPEALARAMAASAAAAAPAAGGKPAAEKKGAPSPAAAPAPVEDDVEEAAAFDLFD
jgi:large subunit ribosomal protein LP0